ncbi:hypothetical protein CEE34_04295 [Candidatus Aerophobetes bacterium Ae_b3a]|nr:MAG: hypothetical protein CEE34_04295 [Candidatus Aerophobetes bacterium Ae_b3a]
MNTNDGNHDEEHRRGAWWEYALAGGSLSVMLYTICKLLTKAKWRAKEIIPLTMGSASLAPVVGPKLGDLVRNIARSLPVQKENISPYYSPASQKVATSSPPADMPVRQLEKVMEKLELWVKETEKADQAAQTKIHHFKLRDIIEPGTVTVIIGKRGSGKSCLAYSALEESYPFVPSCVIGLSKEGAKYLPEGIGVYPSLKEAPFGSVVLIDEAASQFPAQENVPKTRRALLGSTIQARQRGHTLIFVTQDTSYSDKNIVRAADNLIIREPAPLQSEFDRREIREYLKKAEAGFSSLQGDKRSFAYVAFSKRGFTGWITTRKPSFWSEELSRAYAHPSSFDLIRESQPLSDEEKVQRVWELQNKGLSLRDIGKEVNMSKSWVFDALKRYNLRQAR